ncbi:MAG: Xaa-Pro peptidase family protein [Sphingomicrobium sp.]
MSIGGETLFDRRGLLRATAASTAISMFPARLIAAANDELTPMNLPPPIAPAERLARVRAAQALMQRQGVGTLIVEPGASLDYFTGVQWWRSERLTAAVIPATGDPIIVTPFFEQPSIAEMLAIPAEIRTLNEDQEPLKLVAGFLEERRLGGLPVAMEETNRFFILDRLKAQLPGLDIVNANSVVRALRMIKSSGEIALMQAAATITAASLRYAGERTKEGMTPVQLDAMIAAAHKTLGGAYDGGLILLNDASAYPHGSHLPQVVKRGGVVLFDCGCSVHGYQSDISRTFVFGADPTPDQRKVWTQMRRGQDIAMTAAKVGAPAGSVDDAVRAAYESWGYGPGYKLPGTPHRTGHGIGMEGHEPVNLVHGELTPLAPGMCFSNEPGIYLPGKFGIRLEDCFHMTAAGAKFFTVPPASIDSPFA